MCVLCCHYTPVAATHFNVLQNTVKQCIAPQHAAICCNTLQHTVLHLPCARMLCHYNSHRSNTLHQYTETHCNTPQHAATNYITLKHTQTLTICENCFAISLLLQQNTATNCNTLPHTATHYTTLQHTVAHCHTLPHTATHCNTL